MVEEYTPFEPSEGLAPEFDVSKAEEVERVDLREVPLETLLRFHGNHTDSWYIVQVTGSEQDRKAKIWHKARANAAIAPIDSILTYADISELTAGHVERGIMEVGKNYILPNFGYDSEGVTLKTDRPRSEGYTKILVQEPT